MERKIILTEDGSHTIHIPDMDEHYHSTYGAIQESKHVFIETGLKCISKNEINILEVGLGTGLNALLTLIESEKTGKQINYYGIEKYPLKPSEYKLLNYADNSAPAIIQSFELLHSCEWNISTELTPFFSITKLKEDIKLLNWNVLPMFDLIYFDAFAPNKQDGLWNPELFKVIYNQCNSNAIFVTYCAQGQVRRDLQSVGFKPERLQGPPGKREMLRAIK